MSRVGEFQGIAQQHGRVVVDAEGKAKTTGFGGKMLSVLTGKYRAENNKAKAAFVQGLKNAYGADVAQQAERTLGMNNGKPLRTRQVRQLLEQHMVIHRTPAPLQKGDVSLLLERSGVHAARGVNVRPETLDVLKGDLAKLPLDSPLLDNIVMSSDQQLRDLIAASLKLADPQSQEVTDVLNAMRDGCPNKGLPDGNVVVGGKTYKNPVVLGEGAHGQAVKYTADDHSSIVLKISNDPHLEPEQILQEFRQEVDTHRYAMEGGGPGSQFLAPLLAPLRTADGKLAVALKNCELGDVKHMFKGTGTLTKAVNDNLISGQAAQLVKLQMAADLIKAMQHLQQSRHMMHLDLKPENVFMNAQGQMQIGDFGEGEMKMSTHASKGTPTYMAPEIHASGNADMKSDTYSVGYMLCELFTGVQAFFDDTPNRFRGYDARAAWFKEHDGLAQGKYSTGSADLDALINGLTHPDMQQRLTFEEALQSPVFQPLTQNGGKEPQARSLLQMLGNLHLLEKQLEKTPDDQALQNQTAWLKNQLMQSSAALGLGVGGTGNVG